LARLLPSLSKRCIRARDAAVNAVSEPEKKPEQTSKTRNKISSVIKSPLSPAIFILPSSFSRRTRPPLHPHREIRRIGRSPSLKSESSYHRGFSCRRAWLAAHPLPSPQMAVRSSCLRDPDAP